MAKILEKAKTQQVTEEVTEEVIPNVTEKQENRTFRLVEMQDAITASIDNINNILLEQDKLIALVEASDKAAEFVEFLSGVREQSEAMKNQLEILICRKDSLEKINSLLLTDDKLRTFTNELMTTLGLFSE